MIITGFLSFDYLNYDTTSTLSLNIQPLPTDTWTRIQQVTTHTWTQRRTKSRRHERTSAGSTQVTASATSTSSRPPWWQNPPRTPPGRASRATSRTAARPPGTPSQTSSARARWPPILILRWPSPPPSSMTTTRCAVPRVPSSPVTHSLHRLLQEELLLGVPIGKERLFEVDVRTLRVCRVA